MQLNLTAFILTLLFFTSCKNSNERKWNDLPEVTNISKLQQTEFVPTLESPIDNKKNVVYATAFLYAWDEVKKILKAPPPKKAGIINGLNVLSHPISLNKTKRGIKVT